jgi:RNA polymerase sigma-70 factor (ECF subfamily)
MMLNSAQRQPALLRREPERERPAPDAVAGCQGVMDPESREWLTRLRAHSPQRPAALAELRTLLLKAARYELNRRGGDLRGGDYSDLADQSANDALVAVLGKLNAFRGDSRFTTWAYKFALYEAATNVRRLSWQGRELLLEEPEHWAQIADRRATSQHGAEIAELLVAVGEGIRTVLTPHQREVLVAITLNDVPIDVLAQRLNSTRGALYKTLHDARQKLRTALVNQGLDPDLDGHGDQR